MKRLRSIIACIWLMQNWRRLSPETRLLIQADMYRILKEKRGRRGVKNENSDDFLHSQMC